MRRLILNTAVSERATATYFRDNIKFMKEVRLSSYENASYRSNLKASVLKRAAWYVINVLIFRNPLWAFYIFKVGLLRFFGARVGKGVIIKPSVSIKYPWLLSIGDHSWIGEHVWIDNLAMVSIGANVCVSQGALLLTGNHNYKSSRFDLMVSEIIIEDGVWIGAKAIVCPGVTCASHAVLSTGGVATHSLEAYGVYQGNPAMKVRERVIVE